MAASRKDPRTANARRLRHEATPAEKRLWLHLKQMELRGGHFRRQAPIGPYYADFTHFGLRLVVELDGGQHGLSEAAVHDARRTAYLEGLGFRVLRFWNNELTDNLDGVVETIFRAAHSNPNGAISC